MRFVKIAVAVFLVLVLCFVSLGLFCPSYTYETRVHVDAPADHVWKVFTDESRMGEWMPGLERVENLEGEPLTVGSKWKLYFEERGEEISVTETVTVVDPAREYAFDMETDPFVGSTSVKLEESGDGTDLVSTNSVEGRNFLWAALLRLMKGSMESRSEESYEKLAELCEASG